MMKLKIVLLRPMAFAVGIQKDAPTLKKREAIAPPFKEIVTGSSTQLLFAGLNIRRRFSSSPKATIIAQD